MITIRTPKTISQPTLIGFEATLKTPHAVFEMSSSGPAVESNASVEGLYGRIAWPRALFRLGSDLVLEQQMFLPCDCSDVAISWQLRGNLISAELSFRRHCPLSLALPVVNHWVIESTDFARSRKRMEADCAGCRMSLGQRLSLTPMVNIAKSRSNSL